MITIKLYEYTNEQWKHIRSFEITEAHYLSRTSFQFKQVDLFYKIQCLNEIGNLINEIKTVNPFWLE